MCAFIVSVATRIGKVPISLACSALRNDSETIVPATSPSQPSSVLPVYRIAALTAAAIAAGTFCFANNAGAYGMASGRLEKCRGDIPCVSTTSVGNPSKFGPPWSYQPETDNADTAWTSLKHALTENQDKGTIVESIDGPDEYYLRAEFPSSVRGIDDVEFRLMKKDALVTYRSAAREAIFIYPLQTPIDFGKNKNRLLDIRTTLGWEEFSGFNVVDTP